MKSDPTSPPDNVDLIDCDDEESTAGALEPGLLVAPQPLGLDPAEAPQIQRDAPDQQFSQWRRRGGLRRGVPARPTLAGIPLTMRQENAEGETEDGEDTEQKDDKKSRAAQALTYIRGTLSEGGVAQLNAMIHDPSLALTTIQQDIVGKLGRSASHGDKAGVRRAIMELVEKVDVSSPKDSAVLVARDEAGDMLSSNVSQQLGRLESGKQSLQMTQGGRVAGQIQSILGQHKVFGWSDGMDRGWRRLTERFGQQANGAIDVVVGGAKGGEIPGAVPGAAAGAAAPAQAPVGSWNVGGGGAAGPAPAGNQPVGSWVVPQSGGGGAAAAPGQPAIGQWTTADSAGPAGTAAPGAPGDAPAIGKWAVPGQAAPGAAGDASQIGKWAVPGQGAPGVPGQDAAAKVGQWAVQPGGPTAAGADGGASAIGKWNVPGAADAGAAVQGAAKGGAAASPPVGQWITPESGGAASDAKVGQWSTAVSNNPVVGKFVNSGDIPLAGDLNLSEILKQNPNVSNVRLVELVQSAEAKQPPKLRAVTDIARSIFGKKFGF